MRELLQQFDSGEAVLLMYLADELEASQRAKVELALTADEQLRAQLERLRAAQVSITSALKTLDRSRVLPGSEAAGVRQTGRLIRQWQIDRQTRSAGNRTSSALRFPWWLYPLAAAAAVTFAFLTWWFNLPDAAQLVTQPDPSAAITSPRDSRLPLVELDQDGTIEVASIESLSDADLSELDREIQALRFLRESFR